MKPKLSTADLIRIQKLLEKLGIKPTSINQLTKAHELVIEYQQQWKPNQTQKTLL